LEQLADDMRDNIPKVQQFVQQQTKRAAELVAHALAVQSRHLDLKSQQELLQQLLRLEHQHRLQLQEQGDRYAQRIRLAQIV